MMKEELLKLIQDDEFGILDTPALTDDEQKIVDAFVPFLLKQLSR